VLELDNDPGASAPPVELTIVDDAADISAGEVSLASVSTIRVGTALEDENALLITVRLVGGRNISRAA